MFVTAKLRAVKLGLTGFVRILPLGPFPGFDLSLSLLLLIWSVSLRIHPNGSGILVQPALIDAHFRKAWMPYFRREGHLLSPSKPFWILLVIIFHRSLLDRSMLTGEELYEAAMAKNLLLLVWMAGLGMRLKLFLFLGL